MFVLEIQHYIPVKSKSSTPNRLPENFNCDLVVLKYIPHNYLHKVDIIISDCIDIEKLFNFITKIQPLCFVIECNENYFLSGFNTTYMQGKLVGFRCDVGIPRYVNNLYEYLYDELYVKSILNHSPSLCSEYNYEIRNINDYVCKCLPDLTKPQSKIKFPLDGQFNGTIPRKRYLFWKWVDGFTYTLTDNNDIVFVHKDYGIIYFWSKNNLKKNLRNCPFILNDRFGRSFNLNDRFGRSFTYDHFIFEFKYGNIWYENGYFLCNKSFWIDLTK